MSWSSAPKRSASPRVSSSASGSSSASRSSPSASRLQLDQPLEHLERVPVHVLVVEVALLDLVEVGQLGQHGPHQAEPVGEREARDGARGEHEPPELREHALAGRLRHARRGGGGEPLGLGVRLEAELGGEAREPEGTQRVVLVGLRPDHAERPRLEVGPAAERVDQLAGLIGPGHRVDREVAPGEVLLDRLALEGGEVVHAARAAVHHPPRAEGLREPEHRARAPRPPSRGPPARDRPSRRCPRP